MNNLAVKRALDKLGNRKILCLVNLFDKLEGNPPHISRPRYRADNIKFIQEIDELENIDHLIKTDNRREYYTLSPYALLLLQTEKSKNLLNIMENVFSILQKIYNKDLSKSVSVTDLLKEVSHSKSNTLEALYYLAEMSIWNTKDNGFPYNEEAKIGLSEYIITRKNLSEALDDYFLWNDSKNYQHKSIQENENDSLKKFSIEYSEHVQDVMESGYQTYVQKLKDFFIFVDNHPISRSRIKLLESKVDFRPWYEEAKKTMTGMVGSGKLNWAANKSDRLGQYIGLFRHFSQKDHAFSEFSSTFAYAGNRFEDMVHNINEQYFSSFSRDLLKDLRSSYDPDDKANQVPASDRIVRLDHNSQSYRKAMSELERFERYVYQNNEIGDANPEERDLIVTELSAGRQLLKSIIIHAENAWRVLKSALYALHEKVKDTIFATAVIALLKLIAGILGITWVS